MPSLGLDVHLDQTDALVGAERVLMYLTGRERWIIWTLEFVPGCLGGPPDPFWWHVGQPHGANECIGLIDTGATATLWHHQRALCAFAEVPASASLAAVLCRGRPPLKRIGRACNGPSKGSFHWRAAGRTLCALSEAPGDHRSRRVARFSVTGPIAPELQSTISSMASATAVRAGCTVLAVWISSGRSTASSSGPPGAQRVALGSRQLFANLEPRFQVPSCRTCSDKELRSMGKNGAGHWGRFVRALTSAFLQHIDGDVNPSRAGVLA